MSAATLTLRAFLGTLPAGHPDRAGVARSIEVLEHETGCSGCGGCGGCGGPTPPPGDEGAGNR